jgi:HSP20 family protein
MNYLARHNNYWSPLADFRREMDTLFDDYFMPLARSAPDMDNVWTPACEVEEEQGHYMLTLEMPGIPKDGIKIEVADNAVTVSGERRAESKKKENGTWYGERRYGKFQRTFTLPVGINTDKIEASYEDGELHLMVPKAESAKPRQIKIENSKGFFGKLLGDSRKREEEQSNSAKERVA